ncbi:lipopolysaccharide biosynthesis protein [Thermobrachium celere]|uniref:lipopolysaccharide biosynthesis protein n=1 Tax=Thermobrachium celere TaxID=53422 RepID=UPI001942DF7B|nr:oligosaccharide flippase family protein [Thermobrachium celere]GFR35995.1 polyhydroxyalkanoate synthase [Thermobrachium celere]
MGKQKLLKIFSSNYFKSIAVLTFGTLISQIITVLVSPIATRLYTPEQLGIYTLLLTIVTLFGPILSGKLDAAIVTADSEDEVYNLIVASILISFIFVILISLGFLCYLKINKSIRLEVGVYYLIVIIILIITAFINIFSYYNNRHKEYELISSVNVLRTITQSMFLLIFGLLKLGTIGLLLSQLIGLLFGLKKQSEKLYKNINILNKICFNKVKSVIYKYRKQIIYSTPAHFVNSASYSMLNFFITELYGIRVFGYYSMSYRMLGLPLTLISINVSRVFFKNLWKKKKVNGNYFITLRQILLFLGCLAIPMVFILLILGPHLFELLFGKGWDVSGKYAQLLAPMFGFRLIVTTISPALIISGKQRLELAMQSLFIITSILTYMLCKKFELDINIFLILISLKYSLIYIYFLITICRLSKLND